VSHAGLRLLGAEGEGGPVVPAAVVPAEADVAAAELAARIGDVQEVLTGFRHGSVELALPGEPRPQVIREWVGIYHQRAHQGLCVPQAPGLAMSPLDMFEHGIRRAGMLRMPWRPDAAYDFLTTVYPALRGRGRRAALRRARADRPPQPAQQLPGRARREVADRRRPR